MEIKTLVVFVFFLLMLLSGMMAFIGFKRDQMNVSRRSDRIRFVCERIIESDFDKNNYDIYIKRENYKFIYYLCSFFFGKKVENLEISNSFYYKLIIPILILVLFNCFIYLFSWKWSIFFPVEVFVGCRLYVSRVLRRYNSALVEQFSEMVFTIARCLRVGVSLSRTFEIIATESPTPTKEIFAGVVSRVAVGQDLSEVLRSTVGKLSVEEYRFFAIIIALQARTGGGLAEMLENFGHNVRKRISARKKAVALASEARASCYVLGGLPPFMAIVMFLMNPEYMKPLYNTDIGIKLVYASIILFFSGVLSMILISKKVLS